MAGHLQHSTVTGHLMRGAGGHLMNDCCCDGINPYWCKCGHPDIRVTEWQIDITGLEACTASGCAVGSPIIVEAFNQSGGYKCRWTGYRQCVQDLEIKSSIIASLYVLWSEPDTIYLSLICNAGVQHYEFLGSMVDLELDCTGGLNYFEDPGGILGSVTMEATEWAA